MKLKLLRTGLVLSVCGAALAACTVEDPKSVDEPDGSGGTGAAGSNGSSGDSTQDAGGGGEAGGGGTSDASTGGSSDAGVGGDMDAGTGGGNDAGGTGGSDAGGSGGGAGEGGGPAGEGGHDVITDAPSCDGIGETACAGESCCTSLFIDSVETLPFGPLGRERDAIVSGFYLDKFEVTVGRFRRFVEAYDAWRSGGNPAPAAGAHPEIDGSGWQDDPTWEGDLAQSAAVLREAIKCDEALETWTDSEAEQEQLPMNCVSWYEAFAFCAWDEARIPTEVEWEYAAKGGAQNRLYPWGDTTPTADFAVYGCLGAGTSACAFEDILVVGSKPNGDGRFGQSDLAGSVREWVLDWMSPTVVDVIGENFAYLEESVSGRVIRSGSWATSYGENQSSNRSVALPTARNNRHGFRCARNP